MSLRITRSFRAKKGESKWVISSGARRCQMDKIYGFMRGDMFEYALRDKLMCATA